MTGTDILHVAYKGSTGARNDIVGGHVDMMFDEVPSVGPNVLAGQVRALGVTGKQRSRMLPDVPMVSEHGAGLRAHRLVRPHGADRHAQADHRQAQRRDARAGRAQGRAGVLGEAGHRDHVDDARGMRRPILREEIDKWAKVVKEANIKLE